MVITGLGVASPIGIGVETFWTSVLERRCGVKRIEAFDPSRFGSQIGAEVEPFKVKEYVPKSYRKGTKVMSRDIEMAVVAAHEAVKDAGLKTKCMIERGEVEGPGNVDPSRFGANIGAGLICADLTELAGALASAVDENNEFSMTKWGSEGMNNLTPLWLLKFLPNMLACHVTIVHDARAPSNTITCGEASSHLAIGEAFRTIARGAADICMCGGAESKLNPMGLIRQDLLKRLNTDANDTPESACRPFDVDRKGTVISEGAGLVILEELEHARNRGAKIYAELAGFGASSTTRSWYKPDPDGLPIKIAAGKALADAGFSADAVDLLAPFGSGLVEHDLSEARGLHGVIGERASRIPTMAIKGLLGNNGAGAGALDFAAMTMAMRHNTVPASLNTQKVDPECNLRVISSEPIDAKVDLGLSTSCALSGGQCAALVIKRFEE